MHFKDTAQGVNVRVRLYKSEGEGAIRYPNVVGVDVIGARNARIAVAQHHSRVINYEHKQKAARTRKVLYMNGYKVHDRAEQKRDALET